MNFLKITEILHKGGIKCSVCGLECEAEIGWGEYYQKEEKEIVVLKSIFIIVISPFCAHKERFNVLSVVSICSKFFFFRSNEKHLF